MTALAEMNGITITVIYLGQGLFIAETNTWVTDFRKGLFWFMVLEIAVHG